MTGRNPMSDVRRPLERALTTARFRDDVDDIEAADFYNFSGSSHDWSPASEAPERPPRGQRTFDTSHANSYDPATDGLREGEGSQRTHDSEPKLLEELVRHQLAERTNLPPDVVDRALRESARQVDDENRARYAEIRDAWKEITKTLNQENKRAAAVAEASGEPYRAQTLRNSDVGALAELTGIPEYIVEQVKRDAELVHASEIPDMRPGEGARERRAIERVERAIEELNRRAAEQHGADFTPLQREDLSGDLRMVIDLPSARQVDMPAKYQVCDSCTSTLDVYQRIFPNVRIDAVNLRMERVYPL